MLTASEVRAWIEAAFRAARTTRCTTSKVAPSAQPSMRSWRPRMLEAIPPTQPTRYGMVVRRADLRTFPTRLRVFNDRRRHRHRSLPGKRAVSRHARRDRAREPRRRLVVRREPALRGVDREARTSRKVAADEVFAYARKAPYLVVTGARRSTVFTPERPKSRSCSSTWAVRVPLLRRLARRQAGQRPASLHGARHRAADARATTARCTSRRRCCRRPPTPPRDYLPLTRANLLRQGFKFLGERYGWGHSYNARDCSGFVSDVYRSFGVQLPRNTRDQAVSPALNRITFTRRRRTSSGSRCCATCRSAISSISPGTS